MAMGATAIANAALLAADTSGRRARWRHTRRRHTRWRLVLERGKHRREECVCVTEREGGREARAAPRMPDGGAEPEPEPEKKKLTGWRAKAAKKLEEAKKGAEKFAKEAEESSRKLAKEADEQLSLAVASASRIK